MREDAPWLSQLYTASFPKGWDAQQFLELLAGGAEGWLIEKSGFILIRCAADEVEIITLAVEPTLRRQGIAEQLVEHMVQTLATRSIQKLFLEVRENNDAAIALYQKHGFTQIGHRPDYYGLPDGSRVGARVMARAVNIS